MLSLASPPSAAHTAWPAAGADVHEPHDPHDSGEAAERARLVGLCAKLAGDWDAAEDLAQEALLVAHRQRGRLYGPEVRWPWLAGIARNLCLHWRRSRSRQGLRLVAPGHRSGSDIEGAADPDPLDAIADDLDLEVELERSELATLLDRAMALLPRDTRRVLVEHYVEESPLARSALRLGLSEGAVAMRLQRGRLALRRLLATDLREEAAAYGLVEPERETWETTRIWCPACGERTLVGRFTEEGRLALHCVGCRAVAHLGLARNRYTESGWPALFRGVKGFKPALNRVLRNVHEGFGHGIVDRTSRCFGCGTAPSVEARWDALLQSWTGGGWCPRCGQCLGACSTAFLALARPEGRAFWRRHPRLRSLPEEQVGTGGQAAVVARLQSVTGSAELAVVFSRDTLQVLAVHGAPDTASLPGTPPQS
jgi:RNA polymerase sigma-70 factor (ECF subfamily)